MPRTLGDALVNVERYRRARGRRRNRCPRFRSPDLTDVDRSIGRHVAELIEDGATLQMGIGSIPNAVLAALDGHKDLGIHTEMFSDGLIGLVETGVVNGTQRRSTRARSSRVS